MARCGASACAILALTSRSLSRSSPVRTAPQAARACTTSTCISSAASSSRGPPAPAPPTAACRAERRSFVEPVGGSRVGGTDGGREGKGEEGYEQERGHSLAHSRRFTTSRTYRVSFSVSSRLPPGRQIRRARPCDGGEGKGQPPQSQFRRLRATFPRALSFCQPAVSEERKGNARARRIIAAGARRR